jgi:hypothetical protein
MLLCVFTIYRFNDNLSVIRIFFTYSYEGGLTLQFNLKITSTHLRPRVSIYVIR